MDDIVRHTGARAIAGKTTDTYEILAGPTDAGLIILCDHASNALPDGYGTLGLDVGQFERHIAYDIGGEGVTRVLAAALGAPAIMTKFSRLLIDPNRGEDDPTLIMRISDGAVVPGNRHLSAEERDARLNGYFRPYHRAIDQMIDQCLAVDVTPTLLSIHSFTEVWRGTPRPWHIGILWNKKDDRLAGPLLEAFGRHDDLIVGDNEPYSGEMHGDCMYQHGTSRGLPHAIVELRQDLIGTEAGQRHWSKHLEDVLRELPHNGDLNFSFAAKV